MSLQFTKNRVICAKMTALAVILFRFLPPKNCASNFCVRLLCTMKPFLWETYDFRNVARVSTRHSQGRLISSTIQQKTRQSFGPYICRNVSRNLPGTSTNQHPPRVRIQGQQRREKRRPRRKKTSSSSRQPKRQSSLIHSALFLPSFKGRIFDMVLLVILLARARPDHPWHFLLLSRGELTF